MTNQNSLDKAFSNGDWAINCKTVGEVVRELQRLPQDMRVELSFGDGVDVVVFNRDQPDVHVSFHDGGDWVDQEDEE
jgi:hypothetical protein